MTEGKHQLEHTWTIWYDSGKTRHGGNWEDNLKRVADFDQVEDFWSTYNHIKRPTSLEFGANYHVFKCGIKPMWEDSANKEGGRFVIKVGTGRDETEKLNEYWEHLLLAMIGEYAEDGVTAIPGGHITGAVLGRRKQQTKISVWTRDRSKKEALEELKVKLISLLQLKGDATNIHYENHNP